MNKKEEKVDLSDFNCRINFAFCPSKAVSAFKNSDFQNRQIENLIKEFPNQDKNNLTSALRCFYICYSLRIENENFKNQDYFYFQIFSKIAGHLKSENPFYGFFESEKIPLMIQEINEMFDPKNHDKVILDSFGEDIYSNTNNIIAELQKWTDLKLIDFNKSYFLDTEVLISLVKIIESEKKFLASQKNKKRVKKIKPNKNDNEKSKTKTRTKRRTSG